jgi:hypothetical protein
MSEGNQENVHKATGDTVYREMYAEMRRFRDYQFKSSFWYSALLVAALGYILGNTAFSGRLATLVWLKIIVVLLAGAIAGISCYLIWYSDQRYNQLRTWTNGMEPEWKNLEPKKIRLEPTHIYHATSFILWLLILVAVVAA